MRERGLARATASAVLCLVAGACLDSPPSDTSSPGSPDARVADPDGGADGGSISLEEGLVAWYRMDQLIVGEGGGTAADGTGGDDGACISSACPQVSAGHIDSAFQFDGIDDEIVVPDGAALHTESGTVAVWVYLTAGSMIVSKPFGSERLNSWLLYAPGDGSVLYENGDGRHYTDMEAIDLGEWTHLAMTWTPDRNALYIGGVIDIEAGAGTAFDSNPVVLGADHDYGSDVVQPLNGLLDDVRIYDRALSEAEIAALAAM